MDRRIILFGPLPPPYGGVAVYMQRLVKQLHGPNVRVWTYGSNQTNGADVRFIAHRRLGTAWALLQEGRGARIFDATHFHFEYPNALLLPIWILAKWFLRFEWYKNVLDGSLPRRHSRFGFLQRLLFKAALESIDEFVVVSEELRRWLKNDLQVRQMVTVIPCLLPPVGDEMRELNRETKQLLTEYVRAEKRVCSIGVFIPDYGFADAADAVEVLRNQTGADIRLLLLDGTFACDEAYRADILKDRDWITVVEKVANENVPAILKLANVFVRAFRDESYGISRIEAIESGTLVIATTAGETRGMLVYDFGNQGQLVDRLHEVLFNGCANDTDRWAAHYHRESEANLRALRKTIGLNSFQA